jgi:YD repeat-containing protein
MTSSATKTALSAWLLYFFLSLSFSANAVPIQEATALQIATNFITNHIAVHKSWNGVLNPKITSVQLVTHKDEPVAYSVNVSPSGYLLIAYDDDFSPVLLYSATSGFDPARVGTRDSVESWIIPETYAVYNKLKQRPEYFATSGSVAPDGRPLPHARKQQSESWKAREHFDRPTAQYSPSRRVTESSIGTLQGASSSQPLMAVQGNFLSTTWNQGEPNNAPFTYNLYTPADTGCSHTYTGCVATATAQIMKYWNWPASGTGSHSYSWTKSDGSTQTLTASFAHSYSWSSMPASLTASSSSTEIDAVARLMSDFGIAANMDYGCTGSGAFPEDAKNALVSYFGYDPGATLYDRSSYTATSFFSLIKDEIDASRPVLFGMQAADGSGGHAIVIDGYQTGTVNQVHINMGWGGSFDGYYDISNNWTTDSYTWDATSQEFYGGIKPLTTPSTCSYSLSSSANSISAFGGNASVNVTAAQGCAWTASSNVTWITISNKSGTGNGTVAYSVTANTGSNTRTGTLTIGGNSYFVTQANSGVFPPGVQIPVNWTSPSGSNANWLVASDAAYEGAYSLKSGVTGNNQKSQIDYSDTFTASSVTFARKVSSESGYDFLRFYIDGVKQGEWSGEQGWSIVSFPLSAGTHVLRWSYEKDVSLLRGSDAAWIDQVAITPTSQSTRQALFVNASTSPNKTSLLRVINTSGSSGTLTATAYDEDGKQLGTTSANLGTIYANQMLTFTSAQLESLIGFTPASGTAKYSVYFSGNLSSFEIINYTRDIATGNLTLSQPLTKDRSSSATAASVQRVAWMMSASNSPNKTNVLRLVNTSSQTGNLYANAYDEAGNVLGSAASTNTSTFLNTISPHQMLTYTSAQIESALGFVPASPTSKYRVGFSASVPSLELINFTRDNATLNLTLVQAQQEDRPSSSASFSSRNVLVVHPSLDAVKTSMIRIVNPNSTAANITAIAYDESGAAVGSGTLGTVVAHGILALTSSQIEALLGYAPTSDTYKCRLLVTANAPSFEVLNDAKETATGNLYLAQAQTDNRGTVTSTSTTRTAYNLYPSSSTSTVTVLRIINTTTQSGTLTAAAYDDLGNLVASNVALGAIGANQMLTFGALDLERLAGYTPSANTRWRLVISANLPNFEIVNYAKDTISGNLILAQPQTE